MFTFLFVIIDKHTLARKKSNEAVSIKFGPESG